MCINMNSRYRVGAKLLNVGKNQPVFDYLLYKGNDSRGIVIKIIRNQNITLVFNWLVLCHLCVDYSCVEYY